VKLTRLALFCLAILLPIITAISMAVPAQALAGTITITPATGPVYTSVTVTGTGFTPANAYSVYWDSSTILASGTTDATTGNFSATVSIPVSAWGAHSISVTSTGDTSTAQVFNVTPSVLASSTTVETGTSVTIYGTKHIGHGHF
jgi:hypothetical protein